MLSHYTPGITGHMERYGCRETCADTLARISIRYNEMDYGVVSYGCSKTEAFLICMPVPLSLSAEIL